MTEIQNSKPDWKNQNDVNTLMFWSLGIEI